jgi:hypothetical protein
MHRTAYAPPSSRRGMQTACKRGGAWQWTLCAPATAGHDAQQTRGHRRRRARSAQQPVRRASRGCRTPRAARGGAARQGLDACGAGWAGRRKGRAAVRRPGRAVGPGATAGPRVPRGRRAGGLAGGPGGVGRLLVLVRRLLGGRPPCPRPLRRARGPPGRRRRSGRGVRVRAGGPVGEQGGQGAQRRGAAEGRRRRAAAQARRRGGPRQALALRRDRPAARGAARLCAETGVVSSVTLVAQASEQL